MSTTPEPDGSVPVTAARVPQGERTRLMRLRLMEATVESLVEVGWTGTTTTVVSQRAGVSRGAQLHHFPSKQDLVVAAVDYLTERRRLELGVTAADLPEQGRTRAALELIAAQYVSPVFFAALELWVAARTDEALHEAVVRLERRFGRDAHANMIALLDIDERRGRNRQLVQATLDLARGLGLAASLTDDSARRASILDAWAETLDRELET
ncbi:TetR/AcrR family transcriptional regulator [Aeromicrobium alkaliterrae]|uniref:TetR/AcrR family transcriptional regulator n=1 Tax=Aeromicrobium alkaliterrae TaxID=302168 RepID=UPI0031E20DC4